MQARRSDSKRWTSLPKEYLKQMQEVSAQNFKEKMAPKSQLILEGRIYKSELLLRLGYLEDQRLKQINFEVSLDYDKNKENMIEIIYRALDAAGSMLSEYFSDNNMEFPLDWKSFKIEKKEVFLKHSTLNSKLEENADKLLGNHEDALVQGKENELEEEKTAIKSVLGLIDEDEKNENKK